MRYLIAFVLMSITSINLQSQTYEVGAFLGGANYIGDVGNSFYVKPSGLAAGGILKWNRSSRHSFRFSLIMGNIEADDAESNDTRRQQRGYSFSNTITEASLGLEFNFWDFDLHKGTSQSAPYLYTGVTYFSADHVILDGSRGGPLVNEDTNWEFAIPMVVGYKTTLSQHLVGALEIGARYTFTDNLDGSNPEELLDSQDPIITFGNQNTNDWYVFTGITFTVTFGRKPCYSSF